MRRKANHLKLYEVAAVAYDKYVKEKSINEVENKKILNTN